MAPVAIQSSSPIPTPSSPISTKLDIRLFPDGLKTSGQHPPVPSRLYPYSEYPKHVEGRALWKPEQYKDGPSEWTRPFTPEEIEELGKAADDFKKSGVPLTGISKDLFPLPTLGPIFASLRPEIFDGRGFILFKNIPVNVWSSEKSATAYLGIGTHFGYFVSQNGKGHILGHVQNLNEAPPKDNNPIRIYRTNKRQFFHTDGSDLVGLLCMARAESGGESDIASTWNIWNTLQEEYPEAAETFTKFIWYADRKGEMSKGEEPWYKTSIFFLENDETEKDLKKRRIYARFDPMNFTTLARFNSGPNAKIPPLSEEQLYALECFEKVAKKCAIHMILEPGDIQLLSNSQVFHARTEYADWPAGSVDENGELRRQRQLMRLWLSTPESEGGWKLPWPDSHQKKRGGVQKDDQPPYCPLGAE